jgi:crotonobetainyl-CoA:carnitine CoA-transferase CaiB-like acyl-CoA transferase
LSVVVDTERPRFLGPALADAITGIYAAYGVLGALLERSRTGTGRLVEVSMLEAMTHFAVEPFAALFALGWITLAARFSSSTRNVCTPIVGTGILIFRVFSDRSCTAAKLSMRRTTPSKFSNHPSQDTSMVAPSCDNT